MIAVGLPDLPDEAGRGVPPIILVTGFLGVPRTIRSDLRDRVLRFEATADALRRMRVAASGTRIVLAFAGDALEYPRLIEQIEWPADDCRWYQQGDDDVEFGKGLLEHRLLGASIAQFGLEALNPPVVKLTAKYVVENVQTVLRFASTTPYPLFGWGQSRRRWIDSRCFVFRPRTYVGMSPILDRIDDRAGHYMEHALYRCMRDLGIRPGSVRARPILKGWSGTSGRLVRTAIHKRALIRLFSWGV